MTDNDRKIAKNRTLYSCMNCDYNTCNKFDYAKHLTTDKHKKLVNNDQNTHNDDQKTAKIANSSKPHVCECGKSYKYKQGLHTHRKTCNHEFKQQSVDIIKCDDNEVTKNNNNSNVNYEKIILDLITQNKELQNTIVEQNKTIKEIIPKIGNNNNSNNNINIKIDNLTLLNDKCKDALSITDFIGLIDIGIKDLLFTSKKGLTNGVSNLFIEQLNNLPLVKRPIWCSDKKRKKLFIKEDEWSEDTNQKKTKEAIKNLTVKQVKNINKYKDENPDWMTDDKKKDRFLEIVKETTSELDEDKQMSIISNLLDTIHLSTDCKEELQNKE